MPTTTQTELTLDEALRRRAERLRGVQPAEAPPESTDVHQARAARRAADAERAAADRARVAEQRAEADNQTHTAQLAVTDADIAADPTVRDLEDRALAGDTKVTAEQLVAERTKAAGRIRFRRLGEVAARRRARRETELTETEQAAAAEARARQALSGFTAAELVEPYDSAVAALTALVKALEGRNRVVREVCRWSGADRMRTAVEAYAGTGPRQFTLDQQLVEPVEVGTVVERVLAHSELAVREGRLYVVPDGWARPDRSDPAVIAEGRAQLGDGPDEAA